MWHGYQYQQNTTTQPNKKTTVLVWHAPLRQGCGCLCMCVGVHESNRTRGLPLHKHHILHKQRRGTWLNAAMGAQREKAERGKRSAPLPSLFQIRFPLKEQRHPTTSHVQTQQTYWLSSGYRQVKAHFSRYCIERADEGERSRNSQLS